MSVIQKIQEKYAKLMAVIIAIALLTFVIMLAFENGGNIFQAGQSTTVGVINGNKIDVMSFEKSITQAEAMMEQQGYPAGAMLRQQAIETAWNQELSRMVMKAEFDKLGMEVGRKEVGDILYGANPPQDLRRQFTDEKTGAYNAQLAKQQIDQMLKSKTTTPQQKQQFNQYIEQLELMRMNEKYNALLANSANFPKWLIEKQNADNSQLAKVSLVREFYTSIADSSVKVTDKEIEDYISKHKDQYKQQESRAISYVAFSALPTGEDTIATRERVASLKAGFETATDLQQYLESQGMSGYYNSYINGKNIQISAKDSIFNIPVGSVYGPYLDGGSYAIAKLVAVRNQPDSVTVRHILISTAQRDQQTGQYIPVRDSASAYKLIDSIRTAIRNGSNFDSVAAQLSEDPGSKDKGGVYEKVTAGTMTPEFNEFMFSNPAGTKGIVKTDFGYHYMEVMSQKGNSPAYKIAYVTIPVEASAETDANASNAATQFAGDSRDRKSFDANSEKLAKEKGINKLVATDITRNAFQVPGVGVSRSFVKKIYEADLGDVIEPERVGDNYIVAIVTEINKEGTQSANRARILVEPLLKNKKKAEIIKKKIGTISTLEAVASTLGKTIETADSVRLNGSRASVISNEPKVIGAAFNPANNGKVVTEAIEGTSGVYVVRVDNLSATPVADANVAEQRRTKYEQAKMMAQQMASMGRSSNLETLKEAAEVKDNRSKFY